MDIEIEDILVKLLEGQTRLETEINGFKNEIKKNLIKMTNCNNKLN
ncbi:hypothetical protein [uncultured Clostridium sp.]